MTYTPEIFDWRQNLVPVAQVFNAGGQSTQGGMTLSGATTEVPSVGGRGRVSLSFNTFHRNKNLDALWTAARAQNGSAFRYRFYDSDQLVHADQLGGVSNEQHVKDSDSPASLDDNYVWKPKASLTQDAQEGEVTVKADLSECGPILKLGHLIGFNSADVQTAHTVMDVSYSGDVATVTINPPLRFGVTKADHNLLFRPSMICKVANPASLNSNLRYGFLMQFGDIELVEVLL